MKCCTGNVEVTHCLTDTDPLEDVATAYLTLSQRLSPGTVPTNAHWSRKLEAAQNVIFCMEVFAQVWTLILFHFSWVAKQPRQFSQRKDTVMPSKKQFHIFSLLILCVCIMCSDIKAWSTDSAFSLPPVPSNHLPRSQWVLFQLTIEWACW